MSVVALPGFLGLPADWTQVIPQAIVPDVPVLPFWEAAEWVNERASALPAPRLLAGYSLGGRLALHAAIRRPDLWSQMVILSAHPGLADDVVKQARLCEDLQWAERFRFAPWERLIADWCERGSLKSSPALRRSEADYKREKLASAMDVWSLGRQDNLRSMVEMLDIPILWAVGEKDSSFCQIARSLKFKHSASRATIIAGCGHRILHDKPHEFIKEWPWTLS